MSLKQEIERSAAQQRQVISEINSLVKDIERCEKTITDLKTELEAVNEKHKNRRTTREDIDYLTDLLKCANKKLTWEKHMASLQKRTPLILEKMSRLLNDPKVPPADETRAAMLNALQGVQAAMERLQAVKVN
jgi:chromosome segregation ATPase